MEARIEKRKLIVEIDLNKVAIPSVSGKSLVFARAAVEWCKSSSTKIRKWVYLYVPQGVFETLSGQTIDELSRGCAPALQNLLTEEDFRAQYPLFASVTAVEEERASELKGLIDPAIMESLPDRYRKSAEQAISLFRFLENKPDIDYSPVFQALLGSVDEAAKGLIKCRLLSAVPSSVQDQKVWFAPYWEGVSNRDINRYENMAQNLKKTLICDKGLSPLGLLRNCIDYAMNDSTKIGGVFVAVRTKFKVKGAMDLLTVVMKINDFRNTRVVHKEKDLPLTDVNLTKTQLLVWIKGLKIISETE